MSVPFKYRQQFRDAITALGGKPITSSDLEFIAARLPPPQFSAAVVEKYASKCPLDEPTFLSFIAEGQKECGLPYDDIAWGLVEGMARTNFFGGAAGGDASCETKDLRAVLDPKIRPVRLDVNTIFASCMSNRERITIAELMLVFKSIFPATQTNFAELYTWARATKGAPRARATKLTEAVGSPRGAHETESHSGAAAAFIPAASNAAAEVQHLADNLAAAAPNSSGSTVDGESHLKPAAPLRGADTAPNPESATEENVLISSQLRGAPPPKAPSLADEAGGESSPPPPPPPPLEESSSPPSGGDARAHASEASSFAAYVLEKERGSNPPPPVVAPIRTFAVEETPTIIVSAPSAPSRQPMHLGQPAIEQPTEDPSQPTKQMPAAPGSVLVEPPPLPPHIRASLSTMSSQRILTPQPVTQQLHAEGVQPLPAAPGPATWVPAVSSESLTLRQVQQLPPEVLEFIQQLDAQRGALQVQLQRELDDLTANTSALRILKERLASLEALQSSPVFAPLEAERQDLIHRMEQWVHATRAGKDAARVELNRLRQQRAADVVTQAVYRDSGLLTSAATTSTYNPAGTAAATAAIAALNDPSPRLARFFETLSAKEKEIKMQEEAMEKLRQIEKRERRLLSQLSSAPQADPRPSRDVVGEVNQAVVPSATLWAGSDSGPTAVRDATPASVGGGGLRVFRMRDSRAPEARPESLTVPPSHLFLSPRGTASAPAAGFTPNNPYLSHNVASRARTGAETSGSVTKRLEDYMTLTRRRDA